MAATAYVLITCDSGDEDLIIPDLSQIAEVTEYSIIDGPYNMIIKLEAYDMDKLDEVVAGKLKLLDKISSMLLLKRIDY